MGSTIKVPMAEVCEVADCSKCEDGVKLHESYTNPKRLRKPKRKRKRVLAEGEVRAPTTNPWLLHVKQFRTDHPELKFKDVLVQAKATYTPVVKSKPVV